ncbi:metal-dependent hydrolase [Halobaculum limi]|uniref:metal-dependent hydrolase n=1 Tax=Halobaculum limi TaxID=3031916 RepID=UPI002406D40E|nr:metal-dependent hydrolase [Halobaculum sp. YSMS11]
MLPLGHATLAYLCYVAYAAIGTHRLPARLALLPVLFGSQFPDLVDKPLAYVGVLTYGRSLAHSVFTFALVSGAVWYVSVRLADRWPTGSPLDRLRRLTPAAFAIGYASHLLGDTYTFFLSGKYYAARFLLYPLFPVPESPADEIAPWTRMIRIYQDMDTHPQIELIVAALAVFVGLRLITYFANAKRPRQLQ